MNSPLNSSSPRLAPFCLCALLAFSVACNRGPSQPGGATGQPAAKRYSLRGRVISVDKNAGTANIDNEPIAGFMDAMIMPYTIKPPSTLDQLQPGDSITADVVVEEPGKVLAGERQSHWALERSRWHAHRDCAYPESGRPSAGLQTHQPERQAYLAASVSWSDPVAHAHLYALPVPRFLPARQP